MRAVILVGGFGTRLRSVVPDLPKPMAPIQGKPFLAFLLDYLKAQGITEVVFSTFYLSEKIEAYFKDAYAGLKIRYVVDEAPLGTGGAMVNALKSFTDSSSPVFVLNGDTFVKCDYAAMYQYHLSQHAKLTMALRPVADCQRYGKVITQDQRIIQFKDKGECGAGLINAGIYLMDPHLFTIFNLPTIFSFESDFLYTSLAEVNPLAFLCDDYFIDIGIPEDYARAETELPVLGILADA